MNQSQRTQTIPFDKDNKIHDPLVIHYSELQNMVSEMWDDLMQWQRKNPKASETFNKRLELVSKLSKFDSIYMSLLLDIMNYQSEIKKHQTLQKNKDIEIIELKKEIEKLTAIIEM